MVPVAAPASHYAVGQLPFWRGGVGAAAGGKALLGTRQCARVKTVVHRRVKLPTILELGPRQCTNAR